MYETNQDVYATQRNADIVVVEFFFANVSSIHVYLTKRIKDLCDVVLHMFQFYRYKTFLEFLEKISSLCIFEI